MNAPTVKLNKNKNVGETMVLIGELLNEVDCTGDFHRIDARRQRNYAARIGIECGLSRTESQKLYLEEMTYNKTDICLENGIKHCVSPTPHCDENNGVEDGRYNRSNGKAILYCDWHNDHIIDHALCSLRL
eukprot:scaffold72667_cov46-Attheya_sp.AAC.1